MKSSAAESPYRSPASNGTAAKPYIGGQAVLEGVMVRSPSSFAIVVRRRDGSLVVRERAVIDDCKGARKWPLVRGVMSLVESLKLGSEALRFSADQMEKDLEVEERAERSRKGAGPGGGILSALGLTLFALTTSDGSVHAPDEKPKSRGAMGFMLLIAIVFLIALPQAAAAGLNRWLHLGLDVQSPAFQAITGAFKLTIVVGYLTLIRRLADIKRVFQYHGAEHKTISTYEADEPLVVANARTKTTLHPRCGTTFLVMVAMVSIIVFTAVGGFLPRIKTGSDLLDNVVFFFEKLPFLPIIAAVTFEIQRVFARYCTTGPLRALLWPGFLVQKITTIEPDDDQLEIALASLRATLFREKSTSGQRERDGDEDGEDKTVKPTADDVTFENYDALTKAEALRP